MLITKCLGTLALLGFFLLGSRGLVAQQPPSQRALQDRLAAAKSLKCDFPTFATGTWSREGVPQAELKTTVTAIQFLSINVDEGSAQMTGNFGTYDLIVRLADSALHFIHAFRTGPLYSTSVFSRETTPGKFKAVHSRHEYVEFVLPGFTSRPEQYYGECAVGQ
ncbi:MAG: hypothetical protein WBD07_08910 [Vicinamibacterales bacterium]